MNWKLAISSAQSAPETAPILLKGSITDNLITAATLGYDAIEVHMRENVELDYANIREISSECGCCVGMVVTGRLNTETGASLLSCDRELEQMAVDGVRSYIHMAAKLNADVVLGWIRGRVPEGQDREQHLLRLGGHLDDLGCYAEKLGVRVNLEVINRYETNLFVKVDELINFLDKYRPRNCYIHLDTFHMNIEEINMFESIKRCGELLGYIHVADNTRIFPGQGTIDFHSVFRALAAINYDGYVSVECMPWPDSNQAAQIALRNIKKIIKEI